MGTRDQRAPVPVSGIWVEHALLSAFLLVASAILFVTRSESSFPVAIKAFHYLDVPWFIVLTLLLAEMYEESAEEREANAVKLRENYRKVYSWKAECERFKGLIENVVKTANDEPTSLIFAFVQYIG